jgi:hypothetical protein
MHTTTKQLGILVIVGLLALVAGSALAQMNVTFDEYGVGTLNGNSLPYSISADPLSGLSTFDVSTAVSGTSWRLVPHGGDSDPTNHQ